MPDLGPKRGQINRLLIAGVDNFNQSVDFHGVVMRSDQMQDLAHVLYINDGIFGSPLALQGKVGQLDGVFPIGGVAVVNFRRRLNVGLKDHGQDERMQVKDGRDNVKDKENGRGTGGFVHGQPHGRVNDGGAQFKQGQPGRAQIGKTVKGAKEPRRYGGENENEQQFHDNDAQDDANNAAQGFEGIAGPGANVEQKERFKDGAEQDHARVGRGQAESRPIFRQQDNAQQQDGFDETGTPTDAGIFHAPPQGGAKIQVHGKHGDAQGIEGGEYAAVICFVGFQ